MTPEIQPRYHLRHDELVWRTVDDETVILDLRQSSYFALNASAGFLWQQLEKSSSETELVSALVEAYDLDEAAAIIDVREFITGCVDRGLLDLI
jgi:hypothetical protein